MDKHSLFTKNNISKVPFLAYSLKLNSLKLNYKRNYGYTGAAEYI